jgi:hypothetical protein
LSSAAAPAKERISTTFAKIAMPAKSGNLAMTPNSEMTWFKRFYFQFAARSIAVWNETDDDALSIDAGRSPGGVRYRLLETTGGLTGCRGAFFEPTEQTIRARADDPGGTPPHMRRRDRCGASTLPLTDGPDQERAMSRLSCYSLALLAALTVTSVAYARDNNNRPPIQPGAHASAVGTSETDIRQQCADEARARWGTTNQDMQRNRDFAASTCMVEHGVRNP